MNSPIELMEKYNTIKDICPFLEKDFKEIIENFQKSQKNKFCLCELLTDLYWDYVFKIHHINSIFTNGYTSSTNNNNKNIIFEEAKHSMKAIIDILIVYDTSYKKNIGVILDLPYIRNEKIFLMSYILEFKKKANPFMINDPCIEKGDEVNESNNNNKNKKCKETNNKKNMENKNTENFSLEEVYKYIQGNSDSKKGKRKNKKKKKKNKNDVNNNVNNSNTNANSNVNLNINDEYDNSVEPDPIVEEFIQYFIDFNKDNIDCAKIKPNISDKWIQSIS